MRGHLGIFKIKGRVLESDILLIIFYLNIILHCLIRKRKSIEKVLIDSVNVPQVMQYILGLKRFGTQYGPFCIVDMNCHSVMTRYVTSSFKRRTL